MALPRQGDNDPVRFLTYLVAALQKVDGDIGQATQSLLGSPQLPPVETLMTALINDIAATPTPFVLVLDDYHVIDEVDGRSSSTLQNKVEPFWPPIRL